jgi:hypothetical protein
VEQESIEPRIDCWSSGILDKIRRASPLSHSVGLDRCEQQEQTMLVDRHAF